MTTVGFSENIVDMLTTPSSISLGGDGEDNPLSGYLEARNYKVQAFSVSKAEEQFSQNLHAYTTDNLLHYTTLPSDSVSSIPAGGPGWLTSSLVTEADSTFGPVAGVSGLKISANTSGGYLGQEVRYDSTNGNFSGTWFSATDFVFSVDVKMDRDDPPIQVSSTSAGNYIGYSQLYLSANNAQYRLSLKWDNTGTPTVWTGAALPTSPYDSSGINASGGVKDLGGGWYRSFIHGPHLEGGSEGNTAVRVYPSIGQGASSLLDSANFSAASSTSVSAGSIFVSRPQLELGIHPTNYVENSGELTRDNLLRYSLLNSTPPYGADILGDTVNINYYVLSGTGVQPLVACMIVRFQGIEGYLLTSHQPQRIYQRYTLMIGS